MSVTFIKPSMPVGLVQTALDGSNANWAEPTKKKIVLDALLAGEHLTVRGAALELDVFYLSQIVHSLRSTIPVKTIMIEKLSSTGRRVRYAKYFLSHTDIELVKAAKVLQ